MAYGVRGFGCVVADRLMVGVFAVASTLYVTVNFAPLNVWNATALPTKGAVPEAIGSDAGANWHVEIKVIGTALVGAWQ